MEISDLMKIMQAMNSTNQQNNMNNQQNNYSNNNNPVDQKNLLMQILPFLLQNMNNNNKK